MDLVGGFGFMFFVLIVCLLIGAFLVWAVQTARDEERGRPTHGFWQTIADVITGNDE